MKILTYCDTNCLVRKFLFWLIMISFLFLKPTAFAEKTPGKTDDENREIRIVTDQAVVDSKARYTEFNGNVILKIDGTEIHADRIKALYRSVSGLGLNISLNQDAIEKIIATGNVKILFDDKVAITEEAIYIPGENYLELKGENTKVSIGDDYISGGKITLNMDDQTFKVESFGEKQVEAVFFSE